jgi:PPP family 3-phenylpropionic acid transporter
MEIKLKSSININHLSKHYAAIQSLHWANITCLLAYAVVILQERGFTNAQIGVIIAVRYCSSIVAQPIVASMADRLRDRIPLKYFNMTMLVFAFIANMCLFFTKTNFVLTLLMFLLIGCSVGIVGPLNDSLAMQYINGGYKLNYSLARGFGSITSAFVCLALSWFVGQFGNNVVLIVHSVLLSIEFLVLAFWPNYLDDNDINRVEKECVTIKRPQSYFQIIKSNKALLAFLLAALCVYMGNVTIWQYMAPILQNVGGQSKDVGLALFILSLCGFPISVFYNRIFQKFGYQKLLIISYFILFMQVLLLIYVTSPAFVFALMTLEIFGGGLMMPSEVLYVNKLVSPENVVKGQSLLRVTTNGIGSMLSNLLNGILLDKAGVQCMLAVSAGIILIGFLEIVIYHLIKSRKRVFEKAY